MFKKLSMHKDKRANMEMLGSVAIGLLTLVIIFSLVMIIGPKITEQVPDDLAADSPWNLSSSECEMDHPSKVWSDNATFISLSAMVIIISVLMFYVFRMRGSAGGPGSV